MAQKSGDTILATDFVLGLLAGEALSARDACYIDVSLGRVYKCDSNDSTKVGFVGFAQEAASALGPVNIQHYGHLGGFSGLTIGGEVYLSTTSGAVTQTAPVNAIKIGTAVSASTIKIEPYRHTTYYIAGSGNYTIPPWATLLYVEGWGAGASGSAARSGTSSAEGGGGAGGGHRSAIIPISALGGVSTVAFTVGAGGTAANISSGTSDATAVGVAGGNTTFGSFLVANGGGAPAVSIANETSAAGGTGGTVSAGNLVVLTEAGANGGAGSSVGTGSAAAGGNATESGAGGGGASSDTSSGAASAGAGGTSTRAGAGGAGVAAYQSGTGVLQATNGGFKGGGGGAVTFQCGGGASARQLISGTGGDGFLVITAI